MIRLLFIFVLTIYTSRGAWAQVAPEQVPEQLYLQFDRDAYVAGERIWYQAYLLQPASQVQSRVLYVDLISPGGQILMQQNLRIEGQVASGYWQIPREWESGYYQFRAFTRWNLNFGPAYTYEQLLPIYSLPDSGTLAAFPTLTPSQKHLKPGRDDAVGELKIALKLNASAAKPREKIQIDIQTRNKQGTAVTARVGVSVRRFQPDTLMPSLPSILQRKAALAATALGATPTFQAERQLVLRGQIMYDDPRRKRDTAIVGFFMTEVPDPMLTFSREGQFQFFMPDFYGAQNLQFLSGMEAGEPLRYQLFSPSAYVPPSPFPATTPLPQGPRITQWQLESRKRQAFAGIFELPPSGEYVPYPAIPSKTKDRHFDSRELIRFSKLIDFLNETVLVKIKASPRGKLLRLFDVEGNAYFKGSPLCLINGYALADESSIFEIPWGYVDSVNLYLSPSLLLGEFGAFGDHGVIAVYLKKERAARYLPNGGESVSIEGFLPPARYAIPSYEAVNTRSSSLPDFRAVEYWGSALRTDVQGKINLEFFHSDAKGWFEVVVEGVSEEGAVGSAKAYYWIE